MTPSTDPEAVVSWQSWIDDLPLPECFNAGQDACQEFISTLAAERAALRARAEAAEAELAQAETMSRIWKSVALSARSRAELAEMLRDDALAALTAPSRPDTPPRPGGTGA